MIVHTLELYFLKIFINNNIFVDISDFFSNKTVFYTHVFDYKLGAVYDTDSSLDRLSGWYNEITPPTFDC